MPNYFILSYDILIISDFSHLSPRLRSRISAFDRFASLERLFAAGHAHLRRARMPFISLKLRISSSSLSFYYLFRRALTIGRAAEIWFDTSFATWNLFITMSHFAASLKSPAIYWFLCLSRHRPLITCFTPRGLRRFRFWLSRLSSRAYHAVMARSRAENTLMATVWFRRYYGPLAPH
jgi:hypothetical protein